MNDSSNNKNTAEKPSDWQIAWLHVQGLGSIIRCKVLDMVYAPIRVWGYIQELFWTAWYWAGLNKARIVWTAVLVGTVLGASISVYIWRRELEALAGWGWGKVWGWLGQRWGRQTVVVVAEQNQWDTEYHFSTLQRD